MYLKNKYSSMFLLIIVLLFGTNISIAKDLRVYYIGNSITDTIGYDQLATLAQTNNDTIAWGRHMIPGAPLEWIYAHPTEGFLQQPYGYWPQALNNYGWDVLSLQPFDRLVDGDTVNIKEFARLAALQNPDIQVYIYARWPRVTQNGISVPFDINNYSINNQQTNIPNIDDFIVRWTKLYDNQWNLNNETQDYFEKLLVNVRQNTLFLNKPVLMVPVGHVLADLDTQMKAGSVPGFTNIYQFYKDAIHFNTYGSYTVRCTYYATILKKSPQGLPTQDNVPAEIAKIIQDTVWRVVQNTPNTLVDGLYNSTAPKVAITSPITNSSVLQGTEITVQASATDNNGSVIKVEFYDGVTLIGTDTTAPYSVTISNAVLGSHLLTAKAYDDSGLMTTSTTVRVTVNTTNQIPTVSITSPAQNSSFLQGTPITINAQANDADGTIVDVGFYDGTQLLSTETSEPYRSTLTNAALGTHSLTAKAYDNDGAVATSAVVNITVNAPVGVSPISLGWWSLDEGIATIAADSTDQNHPLTLTNTTWVTGKIGKALQFNGSNAVASSVASIIDTTQSFSISAWVKLNSLNGWQSIVNQDGSKISGFWLIYSADLGNKFSFAMHDVDNDPSVPYRAVAQTAAVAGQWYHLVGVRDKAAGTIKLYLNGIQQALLQYPGNWAANGTLNIGRGQYLGFRDWLNGAVDDVRAYNYVLSDVQIAQLYNAAPANLLPSVNLISPANNAVYNQGNTINLAANATDSDGTITKVEFYDGATLLNTVSAAPYSYTWLTSVTTAAGAHSLTAKAYDNAGAVSTSAAVMLTVNATNKAPTVALTAPANNISITQGASVTVSANATDADGTVSKVEFYDGATLLNTVSAAPYSYTWLTSVTTAAGAHSLTAKAYDNAGAVSTSAVVMLTVNATNKAPTVALTAPVSKTNILQGGSVTISANATDSDGTISKVEFYDGATLLNTDSVAPYTFVAVTNASTPSGLHSYTAKAYDNTGLASTSTAISISVNALSAIFGVTGGTAFTDSVSVGSVLTGIAIRSSTLVNRIQGIATPVNLASHGGTGGTLVNVSWPANEYLVRIYGQYGSVGTIAKISFVTNTGRVLGPYGTAQSQGTLTSFDYTVPVGRLIKGFIGRTNSTSLRAIGVIYGQ